jgi:hypothetical protein
VTDARLRARERAASTGDVHDQARLLLERVRSGRLSRERLELAAYCGDGPARAAAGVESLPSWPECACGRPGEDRACLRCGPDATLKAFLGGLDWSWGTRPLVVASLAAIVPAAEEEHAWRSRNGHDSCRRLVRVVRESMDAWLAADTHEAAAVAAGDWAKWTSYGDVPDFLPKLQWPVVAERAPVVKRRALCLAVLRAGGRCGDQVVLDAARPAIVSWALSEAP